MYSAKEQEEFEQQRVYAIMNAGYKFITLRLNKTTMKNVAGIEVVNATPYDDPKGMGELFHFVVTGGAASFSADKNKGGMWFDYWVDTEHNRNLLASHWDDDQTERYWEIEDKEVEKDVIKRNRKMAKVAFKTPVEIGDMVQTVKEIDRKLQNCEKKDEVLLRQQKQELLEKISDVTGDKNIAKFKEPVQESSIVNIGNKM